MVNFYRSGAVVSVFRVLYEGALKYNVQAKGQVLSLLNHALFDSGLPRTPNQPHFFKSKYHIYVVLGEAFASCHWQPLVSILAYSINPNNTFLP